MIKPFYCEVVIYTNWFFHRFKLGYERQDPQIPPLFFYIHFILID
jgi:hypothetical protein